MLDNELRQFYQPTKLADFCMTDDRFLLADFMGRQKRPTLSIVWDPAYWMNVIKFSLWCLWRYQAKTVWASDGRPYQASFYRSSI